MRFRIYTYLAGIILLPAMAHAMAVTDLPGTSQAATEASNTLNNWKESVTQTAAIQKTVSAVGTAQKGLTTAMNAITDFQATVADYQAQIAQAQADIKAAADTVKNADKIAKGLADRAINSVKDTAMTTVNGVKDTAIGTVNSVKDTAMSVKDQAVGMGEMAKDTAGIKGGQGNGGSGTTAESAQGNQDENTVETETVGGVSGAKASASDIVDTPSAAPSRRAISTGSAAQAVASAAASGGGTAQSVAVSAAPVAQAASVSAAVAPVRQAVSAPVAVQTPAAATVQTLDKAEVAQQVLEQPKQVVLTGQAAVSDIRAEGVKELKALAPAENAGLLKETESLKLEKTSDAKAVKNVQAVQNKVADKAIKIDAAKTELKESVKAVPAQLKTNVKSLNTPAKRIDNRQLKQIAPQIETEKATRPARASFKTSAGYGRIRTSTPLAFAQMSTKGGTAMGNIMIVPRDIFIRCMLDHEKAAEKDKFDECLKKINDIRMSEITEEINKGMIDDATMDLYNGYAEMLASGFLEAFEAYNDSVDFYHKQIHPNQEVNNQRVADVSAGWALSKDMNRLLDDRLNVLNKLWGRQLLTKGFESYINSGIKTPEEKSEEKTPLNTNMYGKVIISSVLVDRCGVSVTQPAIDEECLKKLAVDLKNNATDTKYGSWQQERGQILNEYASAYNQRAAKALAAVGDNFQAIAGLTGMDLSGAANLSEPDVLTKITDNNAIANEAAAKILDALDLRASTIMLDSINRMLLELVPSMNTDGTALQQG